MRQLTITIADDFYETFINFFKHIPQVSVIKKKEYEVPLWQQELVLERMKSAKPEDYRNWEEVKKEMDEKWNFNG